MTRQQTFEFLKSKEIPTVPNGKVADFVPGFIEGLRKDLAIDDTPLVKLTDNPNDKVEQIDLMARRVQREMFDSLCRLVVYTDAEKRGGEGMKLMDAYAALQQYPDCWCSQYKVSTLDDSGFSTRMLAIGKFGFVIEYSSQDWRSHNGEARTAVTHRFEGDRHSKLTNPIYAVDFVGDPLMAIDFETENISLGPVEKYITPHEVQQEVEAFYAMLKNDTTLQ